MDHKRIILNAISSVLGYQGREAAIYEGIVEGYESAQKLKYYPKEYIKGCRQANLNLMHEFLSYWASQYGLNPDCPGYKDFHMEMRNIQPYGDYVGYLSLEDFGIIRKSINKAQNRLVPSLNGHEENQQGGSKKEPVYNKRIFVSVESWNLFNNLVDELTTEHPYFGFSFIYRKMLDDGFLYEGVGMKEFLSFLQSTFPELSDLENKDKLESFYRVKTSGREDKYIKARKKFFPNFRSS
ncbi:MAG: hypothetical protein GXY59_03200 [Bacteroidales bacterium]|nr:hypothetical protein [Bacteroidales bacterium]